MKLKRSPHYLKGLSEKDRHNLCIERALLFNQMVSNGTKKKTIARAAGLSYPQTLNICYRGKRIAMIKMGIALKSINCARIN